MRALGKRVSLKGGRGFESPPLRHIPYFVEQLPLQQPHIFLLQRVRLTTKERRASDPLVVPNVAPLLKKCALYTPNAAIRVATKSSATMTQCATAQQLFSSLDFFKNIKEGGNKANAVHPMPGIEKKQLERYPKTHENLIAMVIGSDPLE